MTPEVWRAAIPGLNFSRMLDLPFDTMLMREHPRLRFGPNGRLYILAFHDDGNVMASFLEPGGFTWSPPLKVTEVGVHNGAIGGAVTDPVYWGDYNDLTHLIAPTDLNGLSPRFITPFSRNGLIDPADPDGPDCEFRGHFIADFNVGAVVFR